tara:strand:- start:78 stop:326 length:249 start_codon:yes stop_codon:yes gene_type:complete
MIDKIIFLLVLTIIGSAIYFGQHSYHHDKRLYYDCVDLKTKNAFLPIPKIKYIKLLQTKSTVNLTCKESYYTRFYIDTIRKK